VINSKSDSSTVTKDLVIIGAGGFAPEGIWVAEDMNAARSARGEAPAWNILGCTVYDPSKFPSTVYSYPLLGGPDEVRAALAGREVYFICMIGDNGVREKEARRAEEDFGWTPATLIHPSAIIARETVIAPGAYIAAGAIVAPYAKIGRHVIVNHHASIGHECTMGDFSQACPGARLNGKCFVGRAAFLGTNATMLPRTQVGDGAVVSAGSVVIDSVAPFTTVIGVPARLMRAPQTGSNATLGSHNGAGPDSTSAEPVPKRLVGIFREIFENPSLTVAHNTSQRDVPEWDSVAHIKLVLAIEQEFGVSFTTEEIAHFMCAGDFARALRTRR
jgi:sugar O-acyltransferase (sialic acid O-acetyltransferase NeuD family)